MEIMLAMIGFAVCYFTVFELPDVLQGHSNNKVKIAEANRDKARAELDLVREQQRQVSS